MDSNETGYSSEQDSESQSIDISRKIELVKKNCAVSQSENPRLFRGRRLNTNWNDRAYRSQQKL